MDAEKVVRQFCDAWPRRDIDELLGFFADGATYHNMPMPPAVGHDAIRGVLDMFVPMSSSIEFDIKHLVADGNVVLTERVDKFVVNGKNVDLPVMGTFELDNDGRITAWRDYFDLASFTNQMA
jgi:limonene-1,2-epoxide hydrolase